MLGVGIIGANPDRGWALDAHIPAIAHSPDLELRAVSTSRPETAEAAARAFGVPAYSDAALLAADPNVDLVVITVKVPHHAALIRAVLGAGKPLLCEWPLGNGMAETEALAQEAAAAGVRTFIGLQARSSPAYAHVRQLIAQGFVGDVLSTSILGCSPMPGPVVDPANAYALNADNGATMLMIPFGHTIDAVCWCLGELAEFSALTGQRREAATEIGTGRSVPIRSSDQIVVAGKLESGAILSAHYRGGLSAATPFRWEIIGTQGDIIVEGPHGVTEMAELRVHGARTGEALRLLETPADCRWAPPGTPEGLPYNVAQAYALIVQDLRDGGRRVPDFADAALRHRMLARIGR